MRNFRSPARRAMLTEVARGGELKRALGVLHALDVGKHSAFPSLYKPCLKNRSANHNRSTNLENNS